MKTCAVVSLKGGCSKSTVAFGLATAWSAKNSVVAVDLDPQGSLKEFYAEREDKKNLEVLALSRTHLEARLASVEGYDLMVLDTPPATSVAMLAAIRAADVVILCLRAGYPDYYSIETMLPMLKAEKANVHILITQGANNKLSKTFRKAVEEFGYPVLKNEMKHRVIYAESVRHGLNATEAHAGSVGGAEWKRISREIEGLL